jgi:hypothetical protein
VTPGLQGSDETRTKLFKLGLDRHGWHLRTRLAVRNMQGVAIFRLKLHAMFADEGLGTTHKWEVEIPEGKGYRSVGISDSSKGRSWATGIDLSIENLVGDGKLVVIHIHQPRTVSDSYDVTVDGIGVARATRFKAEPKFRFSSWRIEIAKGFDLALVCCSYPRANGNLRHTTIMLTF